jgi:hypothetical protein
MTLIAHADVHELPADTQLVHVAVDGVHLPADPIRGPGCVDSPPPRRERAPTRC